MLSLPKHLYRGSKPNYLRSGDASTKLRRTFFFLLKTYTLRISTIRMKLWLMSFFLLIVSVKGV